MRETTRRRRAGLLLLVLGSMACGARPSSQPDGGGPAPPAPDQRLLFAVLPDQGGLVFQSNVHASQIGITSDIWLQPLPDGAPLLLGQQGLPNIYGSTVFGDGLWTPALASPWHFPDGAYVNAISPDGRFVVYWATPDWEKQAPGPLELVRTADCANGSCTPVTLVDDAVLPNAAVSDDGRFVAAFGFDDPTVTFIDTAGPAATPLAPPTPGSQALPPVFSHDGSLLAIGTSSTTAPAFSLFDTATAGALAWTVPSGEVVPFSTFLDDDSLFAVIIATGTQTPTPYLMTASGATPIASHGSIIIGRRYLTDAAPPGAPLTMMDLLDANHRVLTLWADGGALVAAADQALSRVAVEVNSPSQIVVVQLSDGTQQLAVPAIPSGGGFDPNGDGAVDIGFANDSSAVVYLDHASVGAVTGMLHVWKDGQDTIVAGDVIDFRVAHSPDTLYYTVTTDPAPSVTSVGTIQQMALP